MHLSGQTIERPENDDIEAAPGTVGHHGLQLSSIGFAPRIVIFIFTHDGPALLFAKLSQLIGLVGGLLAFVLCGDHVCKGRP